MNSTIFKVLLQTGSGWLIFLFFSLNVSAGEMSSASYRIADDVLGGGGGMLLSSTYSSYATIGQASAIGHSNSTSYHNSAGFWHFLTMAGDINGDGNIDLSDVIRILQILTKQNINHILKEADINADGKIGLEELLNALKKSAQ